MRQRERVELGFSIAVYPQTCPQTLANTGLSVNGASFGRLLTGQIASANGILLFSTLRNERVRLPYFLRYYRDLGVNHFLIVDNDSEDGSHENFWKPNRMCRCGLQDTAIAVPVRGGLAKLVTNEIRPWALGTGGRP